MSDKMQVVSDRTFEEVVLESELPVLVDFWAEWCGPCKMLTPILEEVSVDFQSQVKFVKVNIDDNTETPAKFGIRGIPTLLLFKAGTPVATKVGALSKAQLVGFLEENLDN